MTDAAVWAAPATAVLAAVLISVLRERWMSVANSIAVPVVAVVGAVAVERAIAAAVVGGQSGALDLVGAVFLAVGVLVGAASAVLAPSYLRHRTRGFFSNGPRWYYFAFYLFWAMLLAIPAVQNLGVAWVLVGVSTGVTCLLVAYSGTGRALEAGWKYLILTTLGLVVALMGILILYSSAARPGESLAALDWTALAASAGGVPHDAAVVAIIFITVGFAAKVGWAPVHHWLPDAHSEAPAPVSAMLSAALLPMVILVLWRLDLATELGPPGSPRILLLAFGLMSLAVSVPFLWAPLPIKRLLAYSSLEHMGVIAIGLGFASPIATAGVLLHVCGHAVAKSLGFYSTMPLFARDASAATEPLRGAAATSPAGASALGMSLGALSGLPPSPLFVSELLIMVGGVATGQVVIVVITGILLALAFAGLARQALEALFSDDGPDPVGPATGASWWVLSVVFGVLLLALVVLAWYVFTLPGWAAIAGGLT